MRARRVRKRLRQELPRRQAWRPFDVEVPWLRPPSASAQRLMAEAARLEFAWRFLDRMVPKEFEAALHVFEEEGREILREAVPNQNVLNHEVLALRRHRIGCHLPAAHPQAIAQVKERIAEGIEVFFECPGKRGDALL